MKIISFVEAARRIGYHPQHLRKLIKAGKFPPPFTFIEGSHRVYTEEMLDAIIAAKAPPSPEAA